MVLIETEGTHEWAFLVYFHTTYTLVYYGIDEWDDDDRSSSEGQADFIVAKHRNGGLDSIRLKFTDILIILSFNL